MRAEIVQGVASRSPHVELLNCYSTNETGDLAMCDARKGSLAEYTLFDDIETNCLEPTTDNPTRSLISCGGMFMKCHPCAACPGVRVPEKMKLCLAPHSSAKPWVGASLPAMQMCCGFQAQEPGCLCLSLLRHLALSSHEHLHMHIFFGR